MHKHEWVIDQLAKIVDYLEREELGEAEILLIDAIEQVAPLLVSVHDSNLPKPLPENLISKLHARSRPGQ